MRNSQRWMVVALAGAVVLSPGIVWAATASFTSTTATPAVTGTSSYTAGKGVYGHETSTSSSLHYGVFGAASGTGGYGVFGSGSKYGVYSSGPLGVLGGKNLVCTRCVTTADVGVLPAVSVYNPSGTDLTPADSAVTALTFSTELFDTAGMHSTTSGTGLLRAPVKGVYMITASIGFAASGTGKRELYLYKNGALAETESALPLSSPHATYVGMSALLAMNAGDSVELKVYQGSGAPLAVFGCSPNGACPKFTMNFVSAL